MCVSKKTKGRNDDNAAMQFSFWDSEITFVGRDFKFIQKNVVEDYIMFRFVFSQKELEVGTLQGTITYSPPKGTFESMSSPFPQVGYFSSREGIVV